MDFHLVIDISMSNCVYRKGCQGVIIPGSFLIYKGGKIMKKLDMCKVALAIVTVLFTTVVFAAKPPDDS